MKTRAQGHHHLLPGTRRGVGPRARTNDVMGTLSGPDTRMRMCLGYCGKMFLSPHRGVRICAECRPHVDRQAFGPDVKVWPWR